MKVGFHLGVCNNPTADLLHCECMGHPVIPHHHNPASTYNKERAAKPGENGLKWVKMGGNSNVPHPQSTTSVKTLLWNNKLVKRGPKLGFKELPTYKTLHYVCTLRARHSPRMIVSSSKLLQPASKVFLQHHHAPWCNIPCHHTE